MMGERRGNSGSSGSSEGDGDTSQLFEFGPFQLDESSRELRRDGRPIDLRPKPAELLLYLVRHQGRVVPKREIFERVWPDAQISDSTLMTDIGQIRAALGDDGTGQQYVQTRRGRGYQFVSEVTGGGPEIETGSRSRSAQPQPQRSTGKWGLGLAVTLVVAVAALAWWLHDPTPVATGPPLTAIAVLAFDDLSPDGDHAWLANGMSEALIESLSRIEALRVPGRTSTQILKRQDADFHTIGEKLRVGSIVEGSIQLSGDRLRVTAQLIPVADGYHLWSARYDRKLDDVFEIQREISQEIAEAIRVELGVEQEWSFDRLDRFARYVPQDVRAYELLRKGIEAAVRDDFSVESVRERLAYYEQALEIDPTYAAAHAVVGNAYLALARASDGDPRQEHLSRARAAIERALELDNEDRTALLASAGLSSVELNWEEALSRYREALELYPKDWFTLSDYGATLATVGQVEEAFVQMQRAVEFEVVLGYASLRLGLLYYFEGDFDTALELFDRAIEREPGFESRIQPIFAHIYRRKGMTTEALQAFLRGVPAEAELPLRRSYENGGWEGMQRAVLDRILARGELRCPEPRHAVMALSATFGDPDRMFDCLELFDAPPTAYLWTPLYDPYRDDPRFAALLRKWNLEDAPFASE